jgi:hypothetical protein
MPQSEAIITLCKAPAKFYPFLSFFLTGRKKKQRGKVLKKYKNARSNKLLGALLEWVFCFSKWQVFC